VSVPQALDRVLRLMSVGSKRFLTNKVDRSVTGLIAQQQCVGPLHTPLADCAVTALNFFDTKGSAISIGEQPFKTLINPSAMARITVGEALTNLVFARITELGDIKVSGNWQWAAKLPHECAALWDAAIAMRDVMLALGVAVQGGKDSLSMAAKTPTELVKAPGSLVISAYAPCPDITATVRGQGRPTPDRPCRCRSGSACLRGLRGMPLAKTLQATPDFKRPGGSAILLVDLRKPGTAGRLGGSSLAQVMSVLGGECPDLDDASLFANAFNTTQAVLAKGQILAGHDRSDGGLIVTLLEMAFAGGRAFPPLLAHLLSF
jgi:phosphoribosylformylglycinamidine synthase